MNRNTHTRRDVLVRMTSALALLGGFTLTRPARAEGKLVYVDLQEKCNHRLTDDLHGSQGNNFASLPQGELTCEGCKFKIGEQMIHLRGKNAPTLPEVAKGIKVGHNFDRLHILHAVGFGENPPVQEGVEVASYTMQYADGTTEIIQVVYGEDLRDWWDWPDRTKLKNGKVAWTGTTPAATANERKIRLFSLAWDNPHPEKKVESIDFGTDGTDCDPFLVALTTEKK